MTNNDELALKSEERIKAIANGAQMLMGESRQLATAALYWKEQARIATDAFQQSGIMQVKAEDKIEVLLAERDDDKKRIADLNGTIERECEKSRRMASRIAELEARTVSVKFDPIPMGELGNKNQGKKHPYMFGAGYNSAVVSCKCALENACAAAGIKLEVGE